MLALRDAHAHGATRVSIGGQHLLTGGADGVVSLYSTKHWPTAAALWSFRCHDGAVTDVALVDALELALSCGRDGRILFHESIADSAKLVSRVICQVTGEVRCMHMDIERRRLYIAGDSLRCLDMSQDRFQIRTIPLVVPFPLVSLAVSPCGRYIAMASASGELGVVPTHATTPAEAGATPKTQFVFRSVLSPTAKKEDTAMYRMSWCRTAISGLMLMVPTSTEVQVYALEDCDSNSSLSAPRMRAIGGLHDRHFTDLHGALVYPITKTQVACLLATRDGLFVGKVHSKTLAMSRHMSERYNTSSFSTPSSGAVVVAAAEGEDRGSTAVVTDVQVNPVNGDVAVGLTDGRISLLRRASPKAWSSGTATGSSTASMAGNADEDAEGIAEQEDKGKVDNRSMRHERRACRADKSGCGAAQTEKSDDDFIDDGSNDGTASVDSSSSASSSIASSDSGAAPEDFGKIVVDLQRDGASLHGRESERPSRWRDDEEVALAHAKREVERQRGRSRFLDDEAEEGTPSDDEEDGPGDDNVRRARGQACAPYDEEDHFGDDLSMEGHTDENGDLANVSSGRGGDSTLPVGRVPAVQDYSFQVGATPAGEEGNCYLAYNSVGYIHCSRDATTVHFHDISHPAVRLQLRDTVLMGTLSPVGAAFIVLPADPTEAQGSVDEAPRLSVLYHAFTPLGAQSEWRVALLPGETVRCMAAGIRYVAVATSHYLRIFSLSGLELAVLSKSQRIVTMVGTSSRKLMSSFKADFDPLVIISLTGTGELQMEVIDVGARTSALPPRTVPLTELPDGSTHQLQWLGWSEDGLLHIVDTAGVVRQFTEDWGGSWVPVYDPRTLVDQSYALWVYGVSESALLAYRYSRDDPSYPAAAASGLSTELVPLFLPLTRTMGEDGLERWDKLLRQQLRCDELKRHSTFYSANIAKYDEVHDHHLLQFFDSALKSQQTTRAMELAMLMEIHDRVVKCAQLANANGHVKLVPKLLALYEMRMATKQKRKCGLPAKEKLASDKKKDELLHKLLGQILPQDKREKPADSAAAAPPTPIAVEVVDEESKEMKTENRTSPLRGPTSTTASSLTATSPSAVSTATTADPNALPSQARRHISFAKEVALSPPASLSSQSTTTSTLPTTGSSAPALSRKLANPFAKTSVTPVKAADQVRHTSLSNPQQSHHQHQSQLQAALPTSKPHSSTATATGAATLLGSSQLHTPPRTRVAATRTTAVSVVQESDAAKCVFADDTTPTGSRVSAARTPSSPIHGASPVPTASTGGSAVTPSVSATTCKPDVHRAAASTSSPAFVARELPTTSATLVASDTPRLSSGAFDPFLEEPRKSFAGTPSCEFLMGSHTSATSAAAEAPISVQSLLDVGHGETAPVVRSDSFGEALRKRYREDEEEDAEEAPLATLPKLSV
ncbi:WD repeat and HMG-box DNA-binding protein, putative [Leishmania donovani]|uniref:WD repeat and HMG-box DNA-binding protein, putative n=1 Tax=Leishmania donovani TaxID=5661 RepID=A0A3Q8I9G0_LEIDO|nr:WD repeat and HMG-box DNA-binding protein, putative [Leishmania donovani]